MKATWLVATLFATTGMKAQDTTAQQYADKGTRIALTGMKILGGWGAANVVAGSAGWAASRNATARYFHQMNTFWGAVNAGIAVLGYTGARRKAAEANSPAERLTSQQRMEKVLLVNAALDVGYIGVGAYLKSRGNSRNKHILSGYGSSVMMQGIFLAVFDAVLYKMQRNNNRKLKNLLENNHVALTGDGIEITHTIQ